MVNFYFRIWDGAPWTVEQVTFSCSVSLHTLSDAIGSTKLVRGTEISR